MFMYLLNVYNIIPSSVSFWSLSMMTFAAHDYQTQTVYRLCVWMAFQFVTSSGCLHAGAKTNKDFPFHNCTIRCAAAAAATRNCPKANEREFNTGK